MNTSFSLHKIHSQDNCPFSEEEYSWFKFGDKQFAKEFAKQLFDAFMKEYGDIILQQEQIIILPSPYLSIPTASNFLCSYFKEELNNFLFSNHKHLNLQICLVRICFQILLDF